MALTHRSVAKRCYEDRLVEAVECLDCGSRRGKRCVVRNREVITCCQAREDFAAPILDADFNCWLLQIQWGLADRWEPQ